MTDKPLPDDDTLPEAEAEERFKRIIGNLANTPHKPHKRLKTEPDKRPER